MHRFHLPPGQCRDATLRLPEREAHHAVTVLRLRAGERVMVLDGAGEEILCETKVADRSGVVLSVRQRNQQPRLPYELTLLQAVPKAKAMDTIIQKATELGAHRIVPVLTERTVSQMDDENASHKLERWTLTTVESAKQCGSAWLPKVEAPLTPQAFLARNERFELPLIASLQNDSRHPRTYFQSFLAERGRMPRTVCMWVGPEGDFTPAEINAIKGAGTLPITLGQLVLRCETAAIYCLSVLNYELQSLR